MPEYVTIQEQIERRTYLKGKFEGKYIGFIDPQNSDLSHENFFDLEVLSGKITANREDLHHWQTGEPIEFQPLDKFLTKLPESLPCEITYPNGIVKNYQLNLNEMKLSKYSIENQVHENNKVFGDIKGEISGYIKHYDTEEREVEIVPEIDGTIILPTIKVVKTTKQTGKKEIKGNYIRWEYYNSDGTKYWGDWIKQTETTSFSPWNVLSEIIKIVLLLIFIVPLFIVGFRIIIPLLILGALYYFFSAFHPLVTRLWSWLIRIIGFAFLLFFVFGIISLFRNPIHTAVKNPVATNSVDEIETTKKDPITNDSIISHFRIWQDYESNEYSGNIQVRKSDFRNSEKFRNNILVSNEDPDQYNTIVAEIYDYDKNKLPLLYLMFDSIKEKHNLDEKQFAEVITSCIQDIPYTLVLDRDCDPRQYNDKFISEYLRNGKQCAPFVKFGLFSPTEFMGNLEGDCDTRTLLLFTILNHYKYDVAMLGSELYKHSVLGINLPLQGISKRINSKRYVIWETTQQGIPPGIIPREISDMRFWNVTLISNI